MSYIPPVEISYEDNVIKEIVKENEERIYQAIIKQSIKVDKEELIKAIQYDRHQYEKGYQDGIDDAVKHGYWFDVGSLSCRCSACGCKNNKETRYCPTCGSKMDAERGRL